MTTIKVSNIPDEGLELHFRLDGEKLRNFVNVDRGMDFRPHEIDVSCTITKIQETVSLDLHLATAIDFDCCRCLDAFTWPVSAEARYTLLPSGENRADEGEWSAEDEAFGFYREDSIDLEALIHEQILLQIPIKPLCREDCRGLCPRCGTNLNRSACRCREDHADSPFAALKNMKIRKP